MQNPVEIVLRGVPQSSALEHYIREQARKLDRDCNAVRDCHVVAEALHRQKQQQGPQFSVRLNITLPGTEVMVNREHGEDVYIALRDAFEAASLQLRERMRRQGEVQPHSRDGTPHPRS
jgi:ribosome-associated translation inhibitor RaiA